MFLTLKRVSGISRAPFNLHIRADKGMLPTGMSALMLKLQKREAANPQEKH